MSNTLQGQAPGDHGDGLHEQRTAAHQLTLMIRVAAMVTLFTGMTVLAGWLGDFPLLKSVLPGAVEMKANTALGLIAAGAALWILNLQRSAPFQHGGQALALFVSMLGLATLGQYLFGWRLGIDEFLFPDKQVAYNAIRGRMSPYSALAFASIGWALLMVPRPRALAYVPATITLFIGMLSAIGYAWNASELTTDVLLPPVAVNTAVAFIFLSTGTLLAIRRRLALQTIRRHGAHPASGPSIFQSRYQPEADLS